MKSYKKLKAQKEVLEKIIAASPDAAQEKEYATLMIKLQIIESGLQVLSPDEREIISLHLIENRKWSEIARQFQERPTTGSAYSERSFKRIQKEALRKIGNFIQENHFEQYIMSF